MIHTAAIALIHAHYVHTGGQPAAGNAHHVLRFARSFKPVYYDQRERAPVLLPVTVAKHGNAGLHVDQTMFRRGQVDAAWEKKSCEGLHMPAPQPVVWPENGGREYARFLS